MALIRLAGITNPVDTKDPIYPGSNFTWGEATMYGRRLPTQTRFNGMVIPSAQITRNIIDLAKELDKVRAQLGNKPITVTSWYRDPVTNRNVGGVGNSQHLLGWAADILISGLDPLYVYSELSKTHPGGLGKNRSYTHLDLRHRMGWSAARWDYGNA